MQTAIINHYPPVVRNIKEIRQIAISEDIEFEKLRAEMARSINNKFILTADERGISRFENMLKIISGREENLEIRRARVLAKWYDNMPYSMSALKKKMEAICRGQSFCIDAKGNEAKVRVSIEPGIEYMLREALEIMEEFIPMNMYYLVEGVIKRKRKSRICVGSKGSIFIKIEVSPIDKNYYAVRSSRVGLGMVATSHIKAAYNPKRS